MRATAFNRRLLRPVPPGLGPPIRDQRDLLRPLPRERRHAPVANDARGSDRELRAPTAEPADDGNQQPLAKHDCQYQAAYQAAYQADVLDELNDVAEHADGGEKQRNQDCLERFDIGTDLDCERRDGQQDAMVIPGL